MVKQVGGDIEGDVEESSRRIQKETESRLIVAKGRGEGRWGSECQRVL